MYIIIVGCGRVGSELAGLLSTEGHNVVVIDKDSESFRRLGPAFNGLTVTGNGFDEELLRGSGIERADAFCAVTDSDNVNIMAAQVAKRMFSVPRVIARVYDSKRADIYRHFGLDTISGTTLFAAMIRDKIIESHFTSYLIRTGELGVIEINVGGRLEGKKVSEVNLPEEFQVITVVKKEGTVIPRMDSILEKGDILIGVVKITSLKKVKEMFEIKE